MAQMHPEGIEGCDRPTEGEKRVFRFLREAARPQKDYICWYEPPIGDAGLEPDFVLFGRRLGLLILEVKDWTSRQILSCNPNHFTLDISGQPEKKTNPDKQAKGYLNILMEGLRKIPEFLSDHPGFEGALKIPIGRMTVFPNIERKDYFERGLQWLIPPERALFQDDLDPAGEILCDISGEKFRQRISKSLPFPFKGLAPKEIEKLKSVIWPEGKFELPLRDGRGKQRFQTEVQALDKAQARLALRLKSGHQIIKGPPGSGKTLVLVHRCGHLKRFNPKAKRILLVCYNVALASYLRRLIQDKGIGIGESGVHVHHFFELCSRILQEPIHYENEDSEYYDLVVQESLAKAGSGQCPIGPFDAILIDEGQDFSEEMLRTVLSLLAPGGDLVIAQDSYQDLYRRAGSWKSLGVKASGRTTYLKKVYRNTVEIFEFTQRFIGERPRTGNQLALLPTDFAFNGPAPLLKRFKTQEAIEDYLISDIAECIDTGEFKRSEIAVLYDDKVYGPRGFAYDNRALPMRVLNKLERAGIPAVWVSQDVRAKEMFDITTDRVFLISIHSSKGLDFDLVYLIGMDHIRFAEATKDTLISLVYVAMTRAKYRLVVPHVEETDLLRRMKNCLEG